MPRNKNLEVDVYDDNVILVKSTTELPYTFIPFGTFRAARAMYPKDRLYIYEGKAPVGYKIVTVPILMKKPEDEDDS